MTEDQQLDYLFSEAKLGIKVEEWVATDVGRYIVGRAKLELDQISADLLEVQEWEGIGAKQLQRQARSLQRLMTWITDAINNGHTAEAQLNEAEN